MSEAEGQPDRSALKEELCGELGLCMEQICFCGGAACNGVRE